MAYTKLQSGAMEIKNKDKLQNNHRRNHNNKPENQNIKNPNILRRKLLNTVNKSAQINKSTMSCYGTKPFVLFLFYTNSQSLILINLIFLYYLST